MCSVRVGVVAEHSTYCLCVVVPAIILNCVPSSFRSNPKFKSTVNSMLALEYIHEQCAALTENVQ